MKKRGLQIGDKYGRLTVVRYDHTRHRRRRYFLCRCDCGTEKVLQVNNVTSGNTKSCGCLSIEKKRGQILPGDAGVINHLVLQYKRHARDRGIFYDLPRDEFERLIRSPCHYCGTSYSNLKKTKNCKDGFRHNGIDRLDSAIGYVTGNVVPSCRLCNFAKRDLTVAEFHEWASRIGAHVHRWRPDIDEDAAA